MIRISLRNLDKGDVQQRVPPLLLQPSLIKVLFFILRERMQLRLFKVIYQDLNIIYSSLGFTA
jgi:hypothetical protein